LFNSSAVLVDSQLVCLLPVKILNLLSLFEWIISLALKSPNGERSIKYTYIHTYTYMITPIPSRISLKFQAPHKETSQVRVTLESSRQP